MPGPVERIEIDAVVRSVSYKAPASEFAVTLLERPGEPQAFTAVGPLGAVRKGETIRVQGSWVDDPKYGRQLKVDGWLPAVPETEDGLVRFLGSGAVDGIGPELAQRLVRAFGLDTLDVLDHHPHRVTEVEGIGPVRAQKIVAAWTEQRDARALMVLLRGHGIGAAVAGAISRQYGPQALGICRNDPYRLALEVPGVGFLTADRLAQAQGIELDNPGRIAAGTHHFLAESAASGHVAQEKPELVTETARRLGVEPPLVEAALCRLHLDGRVVVEPVGERVLVYLSPLNRAETEAAAALKERAGCARKPPSNDEIELALRSFSSKAEIELAPAQVGAVKEALQHSISMITGGPGTGKTTLIRALLHAFSRQKRSVRLAAPTGRAAKRMEEATGQTASTLHRLLEIDPRTGRFQRGPEAPIEADVVVVDEVSMVDLPLFSSLLSALDPATDLILVGDRDQLPSVGPGRVLADLLELPIPAVQLTEIFRQAKSSLIVTNAHRVNQGAPVHLPPREAGLSDFYLLERAQPQKVVDLVLELVGTRIPNRFDVHPIEDIQLLVPMHKGSLGAGTLNEALQQRLNPGEGGLRRGGFQYRPGDKVMQTRNDYELGVLNGEVGTIEGLDEKAQRLSVRFEDDIVRYEAKDLDNLTLAYACSIHKSQGSEYPVVVLVLGRQHKHMLDRKLLYTAMTRAKRLLMVVAEPGVVASAARPSRSGPRVSGLVDRTRDARVAAGLGPNPAGHDR